MCKNDNAKEYSYNDSRTIDQIKLKKCIIMNTY